MTNPLPELQKGDAIKYGKDWMSLNHKDDVATGVAGWNLDSDGKYQGVFTSIENVQEVWRDLVCLWRRE